jgi:hypothetical protein
MLRFRATSESQQLGLFFGKEVATRLQFDIPPTSTSLVFSGTQLTRPLVNLDFL